MKLHNVSRETLAWLELEVISLSKELKTVQKALNQALKAIIRPVKE